MEKGAEGSRKDGAEVLRSREGGVGTPLPMVESTQKPSRLSFSSYWSPPSLFTALIMSHYEIPRIGLYIVLVTTNKRPRPNNPDQVPRWD